MSIDDPRRWAASDAPALVFEKVRSVTHLRTVSLRRGMPVLAVVIAFAFIVGRLAASSSSRHDLVVLGIVPIAVAIVWLSPRTSLYGLVTWTVSLGFLRRVLPGGANAGFSGDPLLLVGPLVVVLLFLSVASRGGLRASSPLAKAVAVISLLSLVEAANPLQGGLRVGLGGILYVTVPLLAFWIGRTLVDEVMLRRLLWLVAVLAVMEAIYGLVQTLGGLPSWDARWVQTSGYAALNVGGVTRSFGSFASSEEYATFLSIGLVCWLALLSRKWTLRLPVSLGAIALLGWALVLESARGTVVLTVVALFVMLAARSGRRLRGAAVAGIVGIALLIFVAGQFGGTNASTPTSSATGVSPLTSHLVEGLASPTGSQSTLGTHTTELVRGVTSAFAHPLGSGTGSVTIAASHFDPGKSLITENDPGNAGEGLGLLGLALYVVILALGFAATYRVASYRRDALGLAAIGLIVVTLFQWLNGDLYSVMWLVWLTLGWVDINYGEKGSSSKVAMRDADIGLVSLEGRIRD